MKETQIRWTDNEKRRLTVAVRNYMEQNPNKSIIQSLNKVQSFVLEKSRVRRIPSIQTVMWLKNELDKTSSIIIPNNIKVDNSPSSKIGNLVTELVNIFQFDINNKISDLELKVEKEFEKLIINFNNRIADLEYKLEQMSIPEANHLNPQNIPEKKKKKILIVGLLADQFNEVKVGYEDKFDLKFWNTQSDTIPKLKSGISYMDKVIVMTKFIGHDVDTAVKNSRVNFVRVSGGLTNIREILDKS